MTSATLTSSMLPLETGWLRPVERKVEPAAVAKAKEAFGFRVEVARNRAPRLTLKTNAELAKRTNFVEETIRRAIAGRKFPSRATVAKIAEACDDVHLLDDWDAANEVINPKSPRYGQPWPELESQAEEAALDVSDGVPTTPRPTIEVPFTFNALGGGSPFIRTFHGVSDSAGDREVTGTFRHGQTAAAVCRTHGRTVTSDTTVGEQPRSSNVWVRLNTSDAMYAPLTYIDVDAAALATLPQCKSMT